MNSDFTEQDYKKLFDLKRIYGQGVCDFLNVSRTELKFMNVDNKKVAEFDPKLSKKIKSGIKRCWKSWMNKSQIK